MKAHRFCTAIALAALVTLTACVDSEKPILTDSKPLLGERIRFQLYSLRDGAAHDPERVAFRWNGQRYVNAGGLEDIGSFTLHAFEGADLIVQSRSRRGDKPVEYALARKLAAGVFLVIPIDEADADEAARAKICRKARGVSCRIETADELFGLARATAARPHDRGGLAVLLAAKSRS